MKSKQKEMIALLVKEGRLAKGYTQKELSELSNISIRSIQRIENGEIVPRSFTLKTIAEILGLPFEEFTKGAQKQNIILKENDDVEIRPGSAINKPQRIILSIGLCLAILFLAWAFIAQSAKFPETNFEQFIFWAIVLLAMTAVLFFLWRLKK
jgi:transcriptional regulator with XRE-family HTH domain